MFRKHSERKRIFIDWVSECENLLRKALESRTILDIREGTWHTSYRGSYSDAYTSFSESKSLGEWRRASPEETKKAISLLIQGSRKMIEALAYSTIEIPDRKTFIYKLLDKAGKETIESKSGSTKPYVVPPYGQTGQWEEWRLKIPDLCEVTNEAERITGIRYKFNENKKFSLTLLFYFSLILFLGIVSGFKKSSHNLLLNYNDGFAQLSKSIFPHTTLGSLIAFGISSIFCLIGLLAWRKFRYSGRAIINWCCIIFSVCGMIYAAFYLGDLIYHLFKK